MTDTQDMTALTTQELNVAEQGMDETAEHAPPKEGLWAQIREAWALHGRDWTHPGFRAVAVYRFGVWRMGVRSKLLRGPLSWIYRRLFRWVRNRYGIELHYTVKIGRRLLLPHPGTINIHNYSEIGDDCIIRQGVTFGAIVTNDYEGQAPKIGNGVHIGVNSVLMGNITIGDNVKIGPNAMVMSNVPANSTVTAMPARVIAPVKSHSKKNGNGNGSTDGA